MIKKTTTMTDSEMASADSEPPAKPIPPLGPEVDPVEGVIDQSIMVQEVKLRHGLEDRYACTTHLPLICFIPKQTPLEHLPLAHRDLSLWAREIVSLSVF